MEGQNRDLQDMFREQPLREADINLVKLVADLVVLQADAMGQLERLEDAEVR